MVRRTRRTAVAVMAKVPGAVEAKSRLRPVLGAAAATRLYECFLRDRLDGLATVEAVDRVIAFTPAHATDAMRELAPPGFGLLPQRGDDLGSRLQNLFGDLLGRGHEAVIAMDSDSPTLPMAHVVDAVRVLAGAEADVVVGPSEDGGYYLIGTRDPQPALFQAIPWSTERVLAVTLERAAAAGLRVHPLSCWFDVDTPADLVRLRDALAGESGGAERSRAFLRELTAAGILGAPAGTVAPSVEP